MSLADIDRRLEEINKETHIMIAKSSKIGEITNYAEQFKALLDETTALKEKRAFIQEQQRTNDEVARRIEAATSIMEGASADFTEWNEPTIRQLVEMVKVLSADKIEITLRGGVKVRQDMI